MSKLNINFNDKNYEISKSALSEPRADFISHLGTIAGEGLKIIVDGVEYSVDPTKLNGAVISLEAVLNNLNAGGDVPTETLAPGLYQTGAIALYEEQGAEAIEGMMITSWEDLEASGIIAISEGEDIELPEMNEYGFYYGVKYSITMEGITLGFTFNEDGSTIFDQAGDIMEIPAGVIIYGDHFIDMTAMDMPVFEVLSNGTSLGADGVILNVGSGLPPKGSVHLGNVDGEKPVFEGDLVLPGVNCTLIPVETFAEQASLTGIHIPNSVTSIDNYAFDNCTSLTSITIPNSVTSIGSYAFAGCTSLESVTIGDSVTSIGDAAFYYCTSLESITVDEGNTKYHSKNNCLIETESKTLVLGCKNSIIPTDGSVTSIGDAAFAYYTSLTSITIPDSVTSIGDDAFIGCSKLTDIEIPDSVISINDNAFASCTSLASITFGENSGLTSIGEGAFVSCTGLTSIVIPHSVMNIDDWAFGYCNSLTNITYNGTIDQWYSVIKGDNWYYNVPATRVQCTDGRTALDGKEE